jgi:hypothetical protein
MPGAEAIIRVLIVRRTRKRRPAATPLVAAWAAILLVLALVVPALATDGPTQLANADVSPRTGTPSTTITFEVEYHNHEGSPPDHVNVVIDGAVHAMSGTGDWRRGVVMHWASRLPVGTHAISFDAADTRRFLSHLGAGTVTISAPEPTPTPKPKSTPTPTPTPDPTPRPDPTPAPTPHSTPAPTPRPDPTPTPTDPASTPGGTTAPGGGIPGGTPTTGVNGVSIGPGIQPTDPDVAPGGSAAWPWGGDDAAGSGSAGTPAGGPVDSSDPSDSTAAGPIAGTIDDGAAGGGSTDGTAGGSGTSGSGTGGNGVGALGGTGSWGALTAALDVLGIRPSATTPALPMLVGTTTATAMAFAFAIFGKKRRDEEPPAPDEVLQAQAARGHDRVPGAEVLAAGRAPATLAPIDAAEAGMPRWRRPSVQAARKSDPNSYVASAHMSFDTGLVSAIEGHERRIIRYRVVRLLDAPDELRSTDIGQLDQGDEVQLLERSGAYWKVLCPDGRQGWLHKMTLGEVVRDEAPAPAQSWSADVDDDVLTAFLTARARA